MPAGEGRKIVRRLGVQPLTADSARLPPLSGWEYQPQESALTDSDRPPNLSVKESSLFARAWNR